MSYFEFKYENFVFFNFVCLFCDWFVDMDKEDALVCFQEHIKLLEQEYDDEKERDKRNVKRTQRKSREAFLVCSVLLFPF